MRILVADVPQTHSRLKEILVGLELDFVDGMPSALRSLKAEPFDLLIIGLQFDESSMFDLIRQARENESSRQLPIICIRGDRLRSALSIERIDASLRLLDVCEYIDFKDYPPTYEGNSSIRRRILASVISARDEVRHKSGTGG
jgi:CheY-like chemotaxis protein